MSNITVYENDLPDGFKLEGDIAIDTETMGLNLLRDRLCVLQFSNGDGKAYLVKFNGNYDAPNLKKFLSDPKRVMIFHFARFDVAAIYHYLNIEIKNVFCTKIASKLVRTYTDSHGLKDLCRELINVQISKQQQSSYWGDQVLSQDQIDYAARDVLYLHQLREVLTNMLLKEKRLELAREAFSFILPRAKLDLLGWNEIDIFAH
ncbi:MAG: rnd2 [Rickettsiaceae bacterium]|jgi:ribonuclease D|nr:rnd2 [Rickettsiaceae bacterium]